MTIKYVVRDPIVELARLRENAIALHGANNITQRQQARHAGEIAGLDMAIETIDLHRRAVEEGDAVERRSVKEILEERIYDE